MAHGKMIGVQPDYSKEGKHDAAAATLGDVLYSDKSQCLVPEQDWVYLVRAVAEGDQRALYTLYERGHRLVFTLALRITGNRLTAEELTVDVFHDVWRRAPTYDEANGTVVGWIMNQARSRAIDRVRLEQRKKRVDPFPEEREEEVQASGPDETLRLKQQGRVLHEALAILNQDERTAVETAFFGEFTHAEVSVRLRQPLGTVKTRIRSALSKLRHALAGKL